MDNSRGSIAFFGTYRPPVPLDIFVRPANPPSTPEIDQPLLDGVSYNHNGRPIPPAALKEMLTFLGKKNPSLASQIGYTPDDAAKGLVTGLVFVSERDNGLETLHVALYQDSKQQQQQQQQPTTKVLRLADIYGEENFSGVRMEDSACFAGGFSAGGRTVDYHIVYVSTKDPVNLRRTPWTVVYKTNLTTGKTERLTPPDQYDLSPAVSPSGKMVAVANFRFNKWNGDIMLINTDIVVMNFDKDAQGGLGRKITIRNGGWPTWGSDNVLFYHSGTAAGRATKWAVHRYDMRTKQSVQVTPSTFDCMTPAAIDENKVAVATIRVPSLQAVATTPRDVDMYRHIEIYDATSSPAQTAVALVTKGQLLAKADHYGPFVLDGGKRIGFHRCRINYLLQTQNNDGTVDVVPKTFNKLQTPPTHKDVGLFRVSGVFPSISKDGSKLAFVDNEFKAVWVADKKGLRTVYEPKTSKNTLSVFSTSWNQNPDKDTLYVCVGQAFNVASTVDIYALTEVTTSRRPGKRQLTGGVSNDAFPSSSPDGNRLVFRSTRGFAMGAFRNLYVIEDTDIGEFDDGEVTQLTKGNWVDSHCSWSPSGDWIVFASARNIAADAFTALDAGCFAIYLVSAKDIKPGEIPVPVRVVQSSATFAGHINHPVFSPDMRSIVFTSDLAAVSTEPVAMPVFIHSVRPYGDIFSIDLRDKDDITKNQDIQEYHRITHSRYEYSTPAWTKFATVDPNTQWSMVHTGGDFKPACPYLHAGGAEGWHMAGHLTIERRCC